MVTAGLDHSLSGGEYDASHYHHRARPTVSHGIHGRIANTPARLLGYGETWQGSRAVLWAEGEVRQAAVFGEHLLLRRRIEADLGGTEIRLTDTVLNQGFDPTPHMLLYHTDLGWPLLDEGTTFEAPLVATRWRNASAQAENAGSHVEFGPPVDGFAEQVYEHVLEPGPDGLVRARLSNPRLLRAFEIEFDPAELPVLIEWVNLRAGDYVVGLEPSTHHVEGEAAARADGTMIWLGHGESRSYHSTFRFLRL